MTYNVSHVTSTNMYEIWISMVWQSSISFLSLYKYIIFNFNLVDDPLVGSIARQFVDDRRTHDKIARNWTKRYAQ